METIVMETIVNQTEAAAVEDKASSMDGDVVTEILDPDPCSEAESEITQSTRTKLKKKRRSLDMAALATVVGIKKRSPICFYSNFISANRI
ncbi:hypothetical protein R1sor_021918 [Riccia sorocarpa]|uniref:Uncharacterized protein n=1 Tax=Riccia sorocarpa TaxID=122646 RepID=A0ABD3GIC6_9MARC